MTHEEPRGRPLTSRAHPGSCAVRAVPTHVNSLYLSPHHPITLTSPLHLIPPPASPHRLPALWYGVYDSCMGDELNVPLDGVLRIPPVLEL